MAQRLRALFLLGKDLGLIPSTRKVAGLVCNSSPKGYDAFFWSPIALGLHEVNMQAKHSYINI